MASIQTVRNQSGTRYRVYIRQRGLPTITRTFHRKTNARDFAKQVEGDRELAMAMGNGAARSLILGDLINEYMIHYSGRDHSLTSRLSWWREHYGHLRMIDLDRARVKYALRDLEQGRSASTINRYKAALSSVFEFGRDCHDLCDNPCRLIKSRTEPPGRVRFLSDAERSALLKACKVSKWDRLHLLVFAAIVTGARLSELLGLRWCDINMKTRRATLHQTKNGTARVLPLTDELIGLLLPLQEVGSGLLFPSKRAKGKSFGFRKHWNKAVKDAGIEDFTFHCLRHTCASYLAQNGATLLQIADVLGHKQLEVTKRYSHLCVDHKQTLVDNVLGNMLEVNNG